MHIERHALHVVCMDGVRFDLILEGEGEGGGAAMRGHVDAFVLRSVVDSRGPSIQITLHCIAGALKTTLPVRSVPFRSFPFSWLDGN